ncbi:MAG: hypothetical protein V7K12_29745, partial [Nostoc sp.]
TAVLLRSGMMGNYHVPFWRAVEGATPSLTLIILNLGLGTVGHTGTFALDTSATLSAGASNASGETTSTLAGVILLEQAVS